jgi:hypothetical protein
MNPSDINEFWDDLLAHIEERRVIPILGQELLAITEQGREVRPYHALAVRLLEKYELKAASGAVGGQVSDHEVVLHPHQELNDAVCALAQRGKRIVSESLDKTVRLWDGPDAWPELVCAKLTCNLSEREWQLCIPDLP